MDSGEWDERYAGAELVWSSGPNVFVEQVAADLPPGRVLDVAGGEGRNALWLADRGWDATLVDFSPVGVQRSRDLWQARTGSAGSFTARVGDATEGPWPAQSYDLVVVAYLQLATDERRAAVAHAARAVAPGGHLIVVAHHSDNLEHGHGGPQEAAYLYAEEDLLADLAGSGLAVQRCETVTRDVPTDDGPRVALDVLLVAVRPE